MIKIRNLSRFEDKKFTVGRVISIFSNTQFYSSISTGFSSNSMQDFQVIKVFRLKCILSPAMAIIEVHWKAPSFGWIKCNTDGASRGSLGLAACGSLFRDGFGASLNCFSLMLGVAHSLIAELCGAMLGIELSVQKCCLWLEIDSQMMVLAFKSQKHIP